MLEKPFFGRGGLDHRAVGREVTAQDGEAAAADERFIALQDHIAIENLGAGNIFSQRSPVDRSRVEIEQIVYLGEQRAQSAGIEKILHKIFPRRPDVGDKRSVPGQCVEAVERQRNACAAGDSDEVYYRVGRSAEREHCRDGVVDALRGQKIARLQVFPNHFHDAPARLGRHPPVSRVGRGNRCRPGQREAKRFRRGGHGRRRSHGHAVARRAGDAVLDLQPLLVGNIARTLFRPILPDVRSASQRLIAPVAAEHRSCRHEDRRKIHADRTHQ